MLLYKYLLPPLLFLSSLEVCLDHHVDLALDEAAGGAGGGAALVPAHALHQDRPLLQYCSNCCPTLQRMTCTRLGSLYPRKLTNTCFFMAGKEILTEVRVRLHGWS